MPAGAGHRGRGVMRLKPDEQEIVDLCREPVLREHFAGLAGSALKTRAPDLTEALAQLREVGQSTLACRDDIDGALLYIEHVCSVRIRAMPDDRGLVEATGLTPLAAALRCLKDALRIVQREAQEGLAE